MIFIKNKKGVAIAIFVIIAIVLAAGILVYFVVKDNSGSGEIPQELRGVFDYYQGCIEAETLVAVKIAGMQGGRIDTGEYLPGSEYAPFSSQLNFLGSPIPYWYYVSGNGLVRENVPTKTEMEEEIGNYVKEALKECDFEYFYRQGYSIQLGEADVDVNVLDNSVDVEVLSDLSVSKGEDSARKTSHKAEVSSKLGKFYDLAVEIYDEEKQEAFFEQYAVDVLYNYAPVDGVEIQCEPKIWLTRQVVGDLKQGLEDNFRTIKFEGLVDLKDEREYFVLDKRVDENVQVMYSKDWPTKIEIFGEGVDDEIMMTNAIGTQEGMGILGFCYVPYHFVYDVSFPAMVQIFDGAEVFQFPVIVVIDNNVPREAILPQTTNVEEQEFDLCAYKTEEVVINIYDINLDSVDANVSYECFNQRCSIGESKNGKLVGLAPACVNGYLHLRAGGFAEKKQLFSSNEEVYADIVMDREYDVEVELKVGGSDFEGTGIVSFVKEDGTSASAALPDIKEITLSEGSYEVKAYVYGNSSITIPATTKRECVEVPKGGALGFLGGTQEKCFDIEIPQTKIENALIGGGSLSTYILESELQKGKIVLSVDRMPVPRSIEDLGNNFALFESKRIRLEFGDE